MGDLGLPELLIVLAIVMVLFGPGRLAGMGRAVGEGIRELRRGLRGEDPTHSGAESSLSSEQTIKR
ncbi:MAG TPA: twin-arginine translocase TatA/TatE family subunit [Roseiflexaceae bacterium]|nr:twin-arginine translocase TatA/TatE family subunit [Roseiflexaceae bacterium]